MEEIRIRVSGHDELNIIRETAEGETEPVFPFPPSLRRFEVKVSWGKRIANERIGVVSSREVYNLFAPILADAPCEEFWLLCLNGKNRILTAHMLSRGSLTASIVHPREVFSRAVWVLADALVFVHNHPSGDSTPSLEDISMTARLVNAGHILGIRVLDHVIIGEDGYCSFQERGMIEQ